MPVTKQKKEEIIAELVDLFKNSKSVVFSDYQGISVKDIQELRSKLREKDSQFKVAKKTLIKIAAKDAGFDEIPEEGMVGQVGVAFSMGDEIAAAKTIYDFSKTHEAIKLLSAFMEGRALTHAEAMELAQIPGKEELLAKLVGSMNAPISGFHGVLYSLMRTFVGVVDAYREKVEKEGPEEAPATEEAPAPAAEEQNEQSEASGESEANEAEKAPAEEAKAEAEDTKPSEESPQEDPSPAASDSENK
jgi:large subunit ribosomal protein L10